MTMSCLMMHWLERLNHAGIFPQQSRLMEFGPQDVDVPRPMLEAAARRMYPGEDVSARIDKIYDGWGGPLWTCQSDFYSVFGARSYHSTDPFDPRAEFRYDLNAYFIHFHRYDIVINFGTAEHVFNIANVFRTAYRLLKPDGVFLNVLPAYGDIDHGFYNVHPILYRGLAAHSGFELCDFQYIDDIAARTVQAASGGTAPYDFDALPIRLADLDDEAAFKRKVYERFLANAERRTDPIAPQWLENLMVFDYCYVALRKVATSAFRSPYQFLQEASLRAGQPSALRTNFKGFIESWSRHRRPPPIKPE